MTNFVIVSRFNPDLMIIVISHIFTLRLKLGFYSFHSHSNTSTDNYNWSFAKKLETFQDSKTCQESKIGKKLWKLQKNKHVTT